MLVFASDLHLTDGSYGETISEGAFRVFKQRLSDLAYDASKREGGEAKVDVFRPVERVSVVLLGDVLDVIRSDQWLTRGEVRPWYENQQADEYVRRVGEITDGILAHNADALSVLRSLAEEGITIHLPTEEGKAERRPVTVPVDVYYTVGNHDWFYYIEGEAYDEIREGVVAALGLANDPAEPFPHDPMAEDSRTARAIAELYTSHRVMARHGDIYDHWNYVASKGRAWSSLGDVIVVELLNRFPTEVKRRLGSKLPEQLTEGLKEVDNVHPLLLIPSWINGLMERANVTDDMRKAVEDIWDELVADFLAIDFVKAQDRPFRKDPVDFLDIALKISTGIPFGPLGAATRKFAEESHGGGDNYRSMVELEDQFRSQRARCVLYGHTHKPEIRAMSRLLGDDGAFEQYYVNTGTWRKVHERAEAQPGVTEFLSHKVMTYAAFYRDGERKDRPFEVWTGTLGD